MVSVDMKSNDDQSRPHKGIPRGHTVQRQNQRIHLPDYWQPNVAVMGLLNHPVLAWNRCREGATMQTAMSLSNWHHWANWCLFLMFKLGFHNGWCWREDEWWSKQSTQRNSKEQNSAKTESNDSFSGLLATTHNVRLFWVFPDVVQCGHQCPLLSCCRLARVEAWWLMALMNYIRSLCTGYNMTMSCLGIFLAENGS